jgi:hypothetical protein
MTKPVLLEPLLKYKPTFKTSRNFLSGGYVSEFNLFSEINPKNDSDKNKFILLNWILENKEFFLNQSLINIKGDSSNNDQLVSIDLVYFDNASEQDLSANITFNTKFDKKISKGNFGFKNNISSKEININLDNFFNFIKSSNEIIEFDFTCETVKENFFTSLGLAPTVVDKLKFVADFKNQQLNFNTNSDSIPSGHNYPVSDVKNFQKLYQLFLNLN